MAKQDKIKTIEINGEKFVSLSEVRTPAPDLDGMPYKLIRGDRSGVFCGFVEKSDGKEVVLRQARRLWYWSGAASLSQLAEDGVSNPSQCKFPKEMSRVRITDVIEEIDMTDKAYKSVKGVEEWKK